MLPAGDHFGEACLLQQTQAFSVVAASTVRLLVIPAQYLPAVLPLEQLAQMREAAAEKVAWYGSRIQHNVEVRASWAVYEVVNGVSMSQAARLQGHASSPSWWSVGFLMLCVPFAAPTLRQALRLSHLQNSVSLCRSAGAASCPRRPIFCQVT